MVLGHILELREASTAIPEPVMSAQAEPEVEPLQELKFMASLNTSNPEVHKARNPAPVDGTCAWILQHPMYQTWYTSEISSLLWLSADPGCGKSVLASFLIDHFASTPGDEQPYACYFFFKSDHLEQGNGIYALQAVLHQLLQQRQDIMAMASSHLDKAGPQTTASLWNTFAHCAGFPGGGGGGAVPARDTICVLDGLDECEQETRQALTSLLSKYFSENRPRTSPGPRLKLLVTSRPDIPFKLAFDTRKRDPDPGAGNRVPASMIRLRGEDEIDAISNDVSMVIRSDIFGLECQGFPPDILSAIETQLVEKADRTFLWVTLVLRLLKERVEEGASRRDIDEILQSRDIDIVYAGLLRTRLKDPRTRKLLGMILASRRPMTVEELSVALAVPIAAGEELCTSRTFNELEYDIVFPHENHLKGLCGHFIRIIRGKVYLVHETSREFLLRIREVSTDGATDTERIFRLSRCREELIDICLTYLHCLASGAPTDRTLPFLHFAAKEWAPLFVSRYHALTSLTKTSQTSCTSLCHPSHPGFSTWMPLALRDIAQTGLSGDGLQDYCVHMLGLMPLDSRDVGRQIQQGAQSGTQFEAMSSNPGAMGNHYFPVELDSSGAVRLDFKSVGWRARLRGSQAVAPAAVTIRGFGVAGAGAGSPVEGVEGEDDKGYVLL